MKDGKLFKKWWGEGDAEGQGLLPTVRRAHFKIMLRHPLGGTSNSENLTGAVGAVFKSSVQNAFSYHSADGLPPWHTGEVRSSGSRKSCHVFYSSAPFG